MGSLFLPENLNHILLSACLMCNMEYFEQNPSPLDLHEDRIKFKMYWAEKHLQNLKDYQKIEEINSSFETRVKWEHDVECLLFFSDRKNHTPNLAMDKRTISL